MNTKSSDVWILLAVVAGFAIPGPAHGLSEEKAKEVEKDPCLELDPGAGELAEAMASLRVAVGGQERPIAEVRFRGLSFLDEERVWRLVGPRPEGEITSEQAAIILARLTGSGLFARMTPTLNVVGDAAVLEVDLVEHPVVKHIVIDGLTEIRAEELLGELLGRAPDRDGKDDGKKEDDERPAVSRCPPPTPPRSWVAHTASGRVVPGIVWKGLPQALERALDHLHDEGYLLARFEGELSTDGTLTLRVDEGRLEALEVEGVEPHVEAEVRRLIGVKPGEVFLVDEVEQGVRRVQQKLPFLEPAGDGDGKHAVPQVVEERLESGVIRYRMVEGSRKRRRFKGQIEIHDRSIRWSFAAAGRR
jgi:hypothetical protein